MDYKSLNVMGAVPIAATFSLAETADKLGAALNVAFEENPCGTFDEFPSYSAKCAGLKFDLLGIPDLDEQVTPEPITDYTLQIRMSFRTSEGTETCDASAYFAELIREASDLTLMEI